MSYLVLTRKPEQRIMIGDDIEVVFIEYNEECGFAKIAIKAPPNTKILRGELSKQVYSTTFRDEKKGT